MSWKGWGDERNVEVKECTRLGVYNPVRKFCEKACRLAHQDYFYEATCSLEQAKRLLRTSGEKTCLEACEKYIRELREERIRTLREVVENVLHREVVEVTEDLHHTVEKALIVLQNLIPWDEAQELVKRWEKHYHKSVQERKKAFQKLLRQARQLAKKEEFAEARQVLRKASTFADGNGRKRIGKLEREIEQHLSRILEQILERAQTLSSEDRFDEALQTLRDAYKLECSTEDDVRQIEAVKRVIEEKRQQRVQALILDLEILLAQKPEELTQADLDRGQEILVHVQSIHPNPVELEPLAESWQDLRRQAEILLDLEATRRELGALWQSPYVMLDRYDKALALARQKAQAYPDNRLAQELLSETERRREEAYHRESELTTAAAQGNLEATIAELERLQKEGCEELPRYSWNRERGLVLTGDTLPAEEAIHRLVDLAREYADQKADEYLHQAQSLLSDDPLAAEKWLKEALNFEYLSQAKHEEIQRCLGEIVIPAQERRQQALGLVQAARERRDKDIVVAWQLVQEASALAPGLREVTRTRDYLRPWLVVHWNTLLRQAEEALWDGDCQKAAQLADFVLGNIESTPTLFEEAFQKAQYILQRCHNRDKEAE